MPHACVTAHTISAHPLGHCAEAHPTVVVLAQINALQAPDSSTSVRQIEGAAPHCNVLRRAVCVCRPGLPR